MTPSIMYAQVGGSDGKKTLKFYQDGSEKNSSICDKSGSKRHMSEVLFNFFLARGIMESVRGEAWAVAQEDFNGPYLLSCASLIEAFYQLQRSPISICWRQERARGRFVADRARCGRLKDTGLCTPLFGHALQSILQWSCDQLLAVPTELRTPLVEVRHCPRLAVEEEEELGKSSSKI